jgi:hypothetical protein
MPKGKSDQEQTDLERREQALKEREGALESDLKKLNVTRKALKEYEATSVASGAPLTINEIGQGKGVEMVTEYDPKKSVDLEAFMNELVTIYVYPDGTQGALDIITPNVNGLNQPIIRGLDQRVKRKYVEALARSRTTNYIQSLADPSRPESIQMKPVSALTYPFVVREDRNPNGAAWLRSILEQPM